jgi:hypothetical protein
MMVFRPNEEHDEWAVYPPAKRAGRGKYIYIVEFDKGTSFWSEVYDACIKAVEDYSHVNVTKSFSAPRKLDEVVEVDLDAPINLDDIPSF